MSERVELLERFRRGGELIAVVTTGAAGPELDYAPQGKWSIRQVVCHLADAELVCGARFRSTIAEDNPTIIAYDQDAWAEKLNYRTRKFSQALESFRRLRDENYQLLKDLPDEAFARACHHSERGRLTLLDLLRLAAEHAENHARQIQLLRQQYKEARAQ